MPRYFFHVVEGEQHFPDEQGQELAGLSEAHAYALSLIEKFLRLIPDWPAADCRIRITLASGEPVLTVLFPALTAPKRTCFGQRSGQAQA
jgi:hypothetical protein